MSEEEWVVCTDPDKILPFLRDSGKLTERKARLFGCACCRRIWHLLADERSRAAVEVTDRFAEGAASQAEVDQAHDEARLACWAIKTAPDRTAHDDAAGAAF